MATTRDQVAAYDYESRRRVTSLVLGVDEAGRDPRRRLNRTLLGSTIIGVLVMGTFLIIGRFGGGSGPALPQQGAVVVKGTGDRYVVVKKVLHPALNLTSALLVGGGQLTEVRAATLDGVPRGLPVGIPNAPDGLPHNLAGGAWTVCAKPPDAQRTKPPVEVLIGLSAPSDGTLNPGQAVVAQVGTDHWLITNGRRYLLVDNAANALGLSRVTSIDIPGQVLNTIPEGPRLIIPTIARGGAPQVAVNVPGANVGDLILSDVAGQKQYYLVQPDGVSPISELVFTLLAADGHPQRNAPGILPAPPSAAPAPGQPGWPDKVPVATDPQLDQPLCVSTIPGQPAGDAPWQVTISVPAAMPQPAGAIPVSSANGDLVSVATSVSLAPNTDGALVLATTSAGQDGTYELITDVGQRYQVTNADAVSRLHLDPNAASPLPVPFVALLPAGPALDPTTAGQEFPGSPN